MQTDIEISRQAKKIKINNVAKKLDIPSRFL